MAWELPLEQLRKLDDTGKIFGHISKVKDDRGFKPLLACIPVFIALWTRSYCHYSGEL